MRERSSSSSRKLIVPEVVQTSGMDCGPASLNCLLGGFGITTSYGRLREACQTNIDGTSIDTLEEAAVQLGLDAEQIMVPVDHLLLSAAHTLPAIIVIRLPNGATHFVVVWRRHGHFLQVMDPAVGRRWPDAEQFLHQLYVHQQVVPAAAWRDWAATDEFRLALEQRFKDLGVRHHAHALITGALDDTTWRSIAALDAAVRMTAAVVRSGGIHHGDQARAVLCSFYERARADWNAACQVIPEAYWSVRPAETDPDDEEQLTLKGTVLIRARGRRVPTRNESTSEDTEETPAPALSPELTAALRERPQRPLLELLRLLKDDGVLVPAVLLFAFFMGAGGVALEAILFQALLNFGQTLGAGAQRLAGMAALIGFSLILLLLDSSAVAGIYGMGRRLETRLRMAFFQKIPRLGDRYFHSRLTSDMAERGHSLQHVRQVPYLGGRLLQYLFELIFTVAGIIWLDPGDAVLAILAGVSAMVLPLLFAPVLAERDFRVRNHIGSLSHFYLDTFLGLVAIRTHGAEKSVRREHEGLVVEWAKARLNLQRILMLIEGLQSSVGFGFAILLLVSYWSRPTHSSGALLLIYWALNIPYVGQQIIVFSRSYAMYRNITLRVLEPLGAQEEEVVTTVETQPGNSHLVVNAEAEPIRSTHVPSVSGCAITFENVTVKALGNTILHEINFSVRSGSQLAIVGPSGAGKSTLVGTLLGWYQPASGQITVDGQCLDGTQLARLRSRTVWVDPAVQLWNRTLLDNLKYGAPDLSETSIGPTIDQADLIDVLERLPDGLQTYLGEGGGLLSGGEGQRVRLARTMLRPDARLVILDEPFRGLARDQRRALLARARAWWQQATLLCITHDIAETLLFDRVLVVEHGQIVEDGPPHDLNNDPHSHYHALVAKEANVHDRLWSNTIWRKVQLENGRLSLNNLDQVE